MRTEDSPLPTSDHPGSISSASISSVASHAGVSVATVSRVMNGQTGVRPQTRDKVMVAVEALGYRMNHLARNLRTAESRLLLTMVPDVGNPFYAEIVRGINHVARQHGYFVLLCDTGAEEEQERSYFDLLRTHRADGAICLDPDTIQHALANESVRLPWVACCEFDPTVAVPYVSIDNHRAASDAIRHLLQRGHQRIGLINSDARYLYARQREAGYIDTMHAAGLTPRPEWRKTVQSLDYAAGTVATLEMMAQSDAPTAIFAVSDTLAIGVLSALRQLGKRVPEDVAVIGFDDIAIAAQIDPGLTTIAQPMRALGETAALLLLHRLTAPTVPVSGVLLDHHLVLRGST
ncbi:LacI family DNA-binding transcriptional regulator [Glaciimonas sp. CA11.2]|uniref:LacI family DNA-binding transcriptional regulator n=1 Tax=unclassified Glaciimonas TaxID=2644401 RepID=UPI002AB47EF6|nr:MULTISPECIES: LacI family DNA-binding transcriptional regulator [unclassified Glaciimonas]MDY7548696.1 LacI family DNA-binding transcriptional regulator [Glaciimonas sp. CA11.2]MEB0013857.1 LacI family DNA-binding transcriptional regulator [Glaciimonas sp. Cout2]MEB0083792.1 LacI family DNA-binding transcriptional regulator [Glaciimonas sp. Gout2]MEB0163941.1 LacI family DNA-binding transcriptional regulator [Glaciimonas sp. CA11.2]